MAELYARDDVREVRLVQRVFREGGKRRSLVDCDVGADSAGGNKYNGDIEWRALHVERVCERVGRGLGRAVDPGPWGCTMRYQR